MAVITLVVFIGDQIGWMLATITGHKDDALTITSVTTALAILAGKLLRLF